MERMTLEAEVRPHLTKGGKNRARREDKVLAVLYGRGKPNLPLLVDGRALRQVLSTGGGNVLVDLQVKEKGKSAQQETVMFKEIQRDMIVKDRLLHVDFIRISMTDQIEVDVRLHFTGEPAGVKEGGVLQILTRELTVKCLPANIPETLTVDLSSLRIGDSVTAGSIELPEKVELITDPEEPLAQVLAPSIEEEEPAAEEGALREGEAAAEKAAQEEAPADAAEE